jgi:hypothetical protein
VYLLW